MSVPNRKVARHALASGLRAALVGTGLPCNAVYDEEAPDWYQQSPAVLITSAGAERSNKYLGTDQPLKTIFVYDVLMSVPLDGGIEFTAAMAEDALDDIEAIVSQWVAEHLKTSDWSKLSRLAPSAIERVLDVRPYKQETLTLSVLIE
jgi:hypothetical protein